MMLPLRFLLARAQETLLDIFGYDLVQVPEHMVEKKYQGYIFLVNCLEKETHISHNEQSLKKHALLMTIVGLIQCQNKAINEGSHFPIPNVVYHSHIWSCSFAVCVVSNLKTTCGSAYTSWIPV